MPTITGDVATLLGEDHTAGDPVALWLLASQPILTDAGTGRTGGKIRIPVASNGTFSVADVPATSGGFPTYQLQVDSLSLRRAGQNRGLTTGSFPLTTDRDLTWIVDNYVPVTVVTTQVYADVQAAAALGATNNTATASFVTNPGPTKDALSATFARVFTPEAYGAVGDGTTTNDAAAINAAAAAAKAAGGQLYAEGTYRINSTITIECDADLSRATFNYYGTGLAVLLGSTVSGTVLIEKTIRTPYVVFKNKPGTGWTAGTVGVRVNNANTCRITFGEVRDFETGVLAYGLDQGTVHCGFYMGTLRNNKRNLVLDCTATGWVNSNTFYDGRYMHNPAEGTAVSGSRQIMLTAAYDFNDNKWVNPSVEGDVAENMLEVGKGSDNIFVGPRFEGSTPKVQWGTGTGVAALNLIVGGYRADQVAFTSNAASSTRANQLIYPGKARYVSESIHPALQAAGSTAGNPATGVYETGSVGDITKLRWSQDQIYLYGWNPAAGAHPTIKIDNSTGRIYLGNGTAAPTVLIGTAGGDLYLSGVRATTTASSAGGAAALPATPAGYMEVFLNGASRRIPYY